jgi:small subunit ribosomal protein S8e
MAWQRGMTKRKKTGGKKRAYRTKRLRDAGNPPIETELGETQNKIETGRSGHKKIKLVRGRYVNVSNLSTGRSEKMEILEVIENPANIDYNRRGVITKGAIIRTERGNARIVSRPGQDGLLNAILIEE